MVITFLGIQIHNEILNLIAGPYSHYRPRSYRHFPSCLYSAAISVQVGNVYDEVRGRLIGVSFHKHFGHMRMILFLHVAWTSVTKTSILFNKHSLCFQCQMYGSIFTIRRLASYVSIFLSNCEFL